MKVIKLLKNWFTIKEIYHCDYCEFKTDSKRGLEIHKGKMHILKACRNKYER